MRLFTLGLCFVAFVAFVRGEHPVGSAQRNHEEKKAATFVEAAEAKLEVILNKYTKFEWAFATNITDENEKASLAYQVTGPVTNHLHV